MQQAAGSWQGMLRDSLGARSADPLAATLCLLPSDCAPRDEWEALQLAAQEQRVWQVGGRAAAGWVEARGAVYVCCPPQPAWLLRKQWLWLACRQIASFQPAPPGLPAVQELIQVFQLGDKVADLLSARLGECPAS